MPKIAYDVQHINDILEYKSHDMAQMYYACNRLTWLKKFRKAPIEVVNALVIKCTAVLDGSWYGDEPEERTISEYLNGKGV